MSKKNEQEVELRRRARADLQRDIEELHRKSARLRQQSDTLRHRRGAGAPAAESHLPPETHLSSAASFAGRPPFRLVVLVASTGGIPALGKVLQALPANFPIPVALVQHRSAHPSGSLAQALGRQLTLQVKDAMDEELLRAGTVYVAPSDYHLLVKGSAAVLTHSQKVRYVRPAGDPLFVSAAESLGPAALAVVLTGLGGDGAVGVRAIKEAGGLVIAQDEVTSDQFSMPSTAIGTGDVDFVLPLPEIGPALIRLVMREAG